MIALVFALALQSAAPVKPEKPEAPLEWNHHLGAALRQAMQKNSQILLLFSTKTCGWCRRLQEETFRDPKLREMLAARVLVHLDLDDAKEIAQSLGAHAVPDVRLYTPQGLPLGQQMGYLPAAPFLEWLEKSAAGKPLEDEPSLQALRLDSALDDYFDLEARGQALPPERQEALLAMAAGPAGETRTEALRLVRKWAPAAAPGFAKALSNPPRKVRLAAYDALSDLGAPLGKFDPWSGPAGAIAELETWLKARPAVPAGSAPALAGWTPALEADLAALEGERGARSPALRERLIAGGPGLVPRLRERSRSLRGAAPLAAARLDEIRFRILLTPAVLRRVPDAAERLAVGSAGARSQALEDILKRNPLGLEALEKEALCDADPLFRETAAASTRSILGPEARAALVQLLKDPEANVRAIALRELASLPSKGTSEAIREYLASEKDPDMVGHAVRSLQEVQTPTSKEVLLSLIVELLKDPDEFVSGQAMAAVAKLGGDLEGADVDMLVSAIGEAADARPQLLRAALKALSRGKLRKSRKTDAILRRYTKNEDGAVRAAAIEALAADRERPAFEEVREALFDKDPRVRAVAAAGLRDLVDDKEAYRLAQDGIRPQAYPDCRQPLLEGLRDKDPEVRLECALTMIYFGDVEEARPVWIELLGHATPAIRGKAMGGFAWFGPEAALHDVALVRWKEASSEERDSLLSVLRWSERKIGSLGFLLEILPEIKDNQRRSWVDAVKAGGLGRDFYNEDPEMYRKKQALVDRLNDAAGKTASKKDAALLKAVALGLAPGLDMDVVKEALKHPEPLIRRMALARLLRSGAVFQREEIETLARDPEPQVRALALTACMPPQDRQLLDEALRHDWLGGSDFSYAQMDHETAYQGKGKLIQLPEALLNERLTDSDETVRLHAAALMVLEGSDEALAYLHRLWREKPDREMRKLLVRGVIGAWEDDYTKILEEILDSFDARYSYERLEFLRELRALKGTKVKAFLRKARAVSNESDF